MRLRWRWSLRKTLSMLGLGTMLAMAVTSAAAQYANGYADEARDWGVPVETAPRSGPLHAPTPMQVPGGRTILAGELKALLQSDPGVVVVDVLISNKDETVQGAEWWPGAGEGILFGSAGQRFMRAMARVTGGDLNRPVVFLCRNSECWLSYNASLHAIALGFTNVIWFRGGRNAWRAANGPSQPVPPTGW